MKTHIIAIAACLLLMTPALAQVTPPERTSAGNLRESVFGLGLVAGPASGLGLSFRHHLPSTVSYEINGGVIKVDDRLSYDLGAEVQFDLSRTGVMRFFVAGAFSYFYSGSASKNDMAAPMRVGAGLGGEMNAGAGLNATVELIFTYFEDATLLPLPQIGLHYYF